MCIFRTLMLLTGVGVFLPSPPEDHAKAATQQAETQVSTPGLIGSAITAVADVAGICGRQPEVCQTLGFAATRLEAKAKYSVRLIYDWANEPAGDVRVTPPAIQANGSDPLKTGSTAMAEVPPMPSGGQSTLRIEDLIPEWRGPVNHKKS